MAAFSEIQSLVDAKLNETPDPSDRNGAINSALDSLWKELVKFDAEKYLSEKPEELTLEGDLLPFEELGIKSYVIFSAASELYDGIYEFDAAEKWAARAYGELEAILQLVIQQRNRQDAVTPYRPQSREHSQ